MFLADNLGFFAGLNDFKFALSRLRIVLWLGTTVVPRFDSSPAWMALDDFLDGFFCSKMMESFVRLLMIFR